MLARSLSQKQQTIDVGYTLLYLVLASSKTAATIAAAARTRL